MRWTNPIRPQCGHFHLVSHEFQLQPPDWWLATDCSTSSNSRISRATGHIDATKQGYENTGDSWAGQFD